MYVCMYAYTLYMCIYSVYTYLYKHICIMCIYIYIYIVSHTHITNIAMQDIFFWTIQSRSTHDLCSGPRQSRHPATREAAGGICQAKGGEKPRVDERRISLCM